MKNKTPTPEQEPVKEEKRNTLKNIFDITLGTLILIAMILLFVLVQYMIYPNLLVSALMLLVGLPAAFYSINNIKKTGAYT